MGWLIGIIEFCILAYLFYKWGAQGEQISADESKIKELEERLNIANDRNQSLIDKNNDLYRENRKLFRYIIHNKVKRVPIQNLWSDMSYDEITDMVIEQSDYVEIKSLEDLREKNMKKVIKTAWCADHGLLDYYQNPEVFEGELFRITQDGDYILLSNEEIERIDNKKFDFILDEIN